MESRIGENYYPAFAMKGSDSMAGEFVTIEVHKEFARRMDEANERQSKRISILEDEVKELRDISGDIKSLLVEMKGMREEQEKQGVRLETLEKRDGEMWRKVVGYIISAVVSGVIVFIFTQIGM